MPRGTRFQRAPCLLEPSAATVGGCQLPLLCSLLTSAPSSPAFALPRVIATCLLAVVALDSVDDESNPEQPVDGTSAADWSREEQPNYSWQVKALAMVEFGCCSLADRRLCSPFTPWLLSLQLYMLWGNLVSLNALRHAKGLNVITLRPHCEMR